MINWKNLLPIFIGLMAACGEAAPPAVLRAHAQLNADTFAYGPTSGQLLGNQPVNGRNLPFTNKQPIQGFSAVLPDGKDTFLVMSDNGFGAIQNSSDYNLRVYSIRPDFKTSKGGSGGIQVLGYFELKDPGRKIPFAIVNNFTERRILTGADFDIESMQRAPDGTLWFGEEFGPFLLHTDANGELLDPPFPLIVNGKEYRSPLNPAYEEAATLRVMNALAAGAYKRPVFSPYHVMLVDGNNDVGHYARDKKTPPGLKPAASGVFDVALMKSAGFKVVPWTVNTKKRMLELMKWGVDGIISDRPDILYDALKEYNNGAYLTSEGLVNAKTFDAQGHRGGRNLRPENTLPAMEVALDNLMSTLETDVGLSRDGLPVLNHDPHMETQKCRRRDGRPYKKARLINSLTAKEIQNSFICDRLIRGKSQKNDPALSPVARSFADDRLPHVYTPPRLDQLIEFVNFYANYYRSGPGKSHPKSRLRAKNADLVRFNVETKINPLHPKDTDKPAAFVQAIVGLVSRYHLEGRVDLQSFDFRSLQYSQQVFPGLRTVYLIGDFPIYKGKFSSDGANLQNVGGRNTKWLAGLKWPYRTTYGELKPLVPLSGGFEGMALSVDGKFLLPMLEKPLLGALERKLLIHQFSLKEKRYTGKVFRFPLDQRATSIGDFIMTDASHGFVIERDDAQGDLDAYKILQKVTLDNSGAVRKQAVANLLKLRNPAGLGPGKSKTFAFPFFTIEGLIQLGPNRLGILNDNNYPFSVGRHTDTGQPDDNEFMIIELKQPK